MSSLPLSKIGLLLLGHGSTLNADSSAPTYQHAEALRKKNLFAQVAVGFWKEEPNFRQALRQMDVDHVFVVPVFISSGYFTEQIIPRELQMSGPITKIGRYTVYQCAPVGLHLAMEQALLQRASSVVEKSGETISEPAKTACLFLCGHGTNFNDNSTKIIYERAESIKARGLFADCQPVLMEQRPFVKDWATLTDCQDVVIVPFFISDGLHSYEDIPVLIGVTPNIRTQGFTNPHHFAGPPARRLWYASAIGTEPFVTEVILQQIEQFEEQYLANLESINPAVIEDENLALATWLADGLSPTKHIGELVISTISSSPQKPYEIRHASDMEKPRESLKSLIEESDLRQLINFDSNGDFRPFHAAPSLRNGWICSNLSLSKLKMILDYFYPAAVSNWALQKQGQLPVSDWAETAERQTGRFKIVRELSQEQAREVVREHCNVRCGKERLWEPAQGLELHSPHLPAEPEKAIRIWCPEACNPYVGKAREKLKGPSEE